MAASNRVNDRGLTVLHESPHPTVDIIFVHGFTGHPRETWALKQKQKRRSAKSAKRHERDETAAKPRSKLRRLLPGAGKVQSASLSPSRSTTAEFSIREDRARSVSLITKPSIDIRPDNDVKDSEGDVYWPADLAPQTAPDSRILTYGYDSEVRHWAAGQISKKSIYDHANDLLCSLEARRRHANEKNRPVLFIVHSLGGLITKVAVRKARDCATTKPHVHGIYRATTGIIFFGTPHRGADPRNFVHHVISASAQFMGFQVNDSVVNTLLPNQESLSDWSHEFLAMCHEMKWHVYSFQEEYGVTGLFGKVVVEDSSSCFDDPIVETKQHIASNHMDMCRFAGAEDPEYQKVAAAITFIIGEVASEMVGPPAQAPPDDFNLDRQPTPRLDTPNLTVPPSETHHGIEAELKESLKSQLYFDKIDERLTNLAAAQGKTCHWFLSSPTYISWVDPDQKNAHGGFLWIKGNPGTGKSTLMKFLFEDAKTKSKDSPFHITISFFFLARGIVEERSTTGLYRSLLHQIFTKAPDLEEALEWMTVDGARVIERNGWQEEALKQTLRYAVQRLGNRSLTLFIDALDECDKQQATGMVSFFEELCELATERQILLQICFSSRHYPTILVYKGIELTLECEDGQSQDIQSYIRSTLRVGKSKAAQSLMSDIFEKSSRIFLWVVLVLDILKLENLRSAGSIQNMRKRLNDIPKGLEDLFEMILARDNDNLDQLQACLKWILLAVRPLKAQELYFAIQFALHDGCDGYWDEDDIGLDQMKEFVRSSSKGLAELTRGKNPDVQFIHESVRDFLLGKYKRHWSGATDNFEGQGHEFLRDCCRAQVLAHFRQPAGVHAAIERLPKMKEELQKMKLMDVQIYEICTSVDQIDYRRLANALRARRTYPREAASLLIEMETVNPILPDDVRNDVTTLYPFFGYAVANVLLHANSSQKGGIDQRSFLLTFPLRRWIILSNVLERYLARRYTESAPLLYLLAERNLADLIQISPDRGLGLEIGEERYGPPLFAAVATGSADAAEALINLESDGNSPSQHRREKFCFKGSQLFIRPNRTFIYEHSTGLLGYAVMWGDDLFLEALLSRGVVPYSTLQRSFLRYIFAPFIYGLKGRSRGIIRVLLERGLIDIDERRRVLMDAAQGGIEGVVKIFLDGGAAYLDPKDATYRKVLRLAIMHGHEGVVKLVLDAGAGDANRRDEFGRTALIYAAEYGEEGILRLLLDISAAETDERDIVDVNMSDELDRTALMYASIYGPESTVRLLLDAGAAVNRSDELGCTALMHASIRGDEGIVRLLLDVGAAYTDVRDKFGLTALKYAVNNGHGAVQDLLRGGIDRANAHGGVPLPDIIT